MGVLAEFDANRDSILLDGEFRRGEATERRDVVDPATDNVIADMIEATATEEGACRGRD